MLTDVLSEGNIRVPVIDQTRRKKLLEKFSGFLGGKSHRFSGKERLHNWVRS